ncbi:Fic family protein [Candidatus Methanomassiliicoccus intestinalis]|uniref:Fic family protein n=1 Tax=Candidatus Methanomassiliicoccus intestinalis TaxID=1406512 RepID=UPI0037DD58F0
MVEKYEPPYSLTPRIIDLITEISESIGRISIQQQINSDIQLRKDNRIRTIHASLAIENNSLSLEQVTDILDGKKVRGPASEILEVKNAIDAYNVLDTFNPYSVKDLLKAHRILMKGLVKEAGRFRSGSVGVFQDEILIHMAPPAEIVPQHMTNLLMWAKESKEHPLIKSCVFHYEFEFIHPFADGNGRTGRMWNMLLLSCWRPLFSWIPVETVIKQKQQEYYQALHDADKQVDSTKFIEFMLQTICESLNEYENKQMQIKGISTHLQRFLNVLGDEELAATELMNRMQLKNRAAFYQTYLQPALAAQLIERVYPDKPKSKNQRYRKHRTA